MPAEGTKNEDTVPKSGIPLVFISHDTRDAELAESFSNLLKSVSAGVLKSFRSSDRRGNQGIEYGVEWYPEIIKNIQSASDVVCLLTKRSVDRPWILFEAGMAKGKLDTPILGLALGIQLKEASTGPFAQFQNCGDEEDSLTKLVFQLVNRIPNSEPDRETIKFQVGKFKRSIEPILEKLATTESTTAIPQDSGRKAVDIENSSAKLFEEIKIMFQDLPSRIERNGGNDSSRRRRRFNPLALEELMMIHPDTRIPIRIMLSVCRDRLPWVYDEGVALLGKLESSKSQPIKRKLLEEFHEFLMASLRNPFTERYFVECEEDFILVRELPKMLTRAFERLC